VARPFLAPFVIDRFPLGTDTLGRDIASGLAHGARVSLTIGLVSTIVALLIGVPLGAIAGYAGGIVDDALMRFTEFFQTIPSFALAIVLVAILQPKLGLDRARDRGGQLARRWRDWCVARCCR
jgi:peptide/nickel transport system permease protein